VATKVRNPRNECAFKSRIQSVIVEQSRQIQNSPFWMLRISLATGIYLISPELE
jgi:hypothetical protein